MLAVRIRTHWEIPGCGFVLFARGLSRQTQGFRGISTVLRHPGQSFSLKFVSFPTNETDALPIANALGTDC